MTRSRFPGLLLPLTCALALAACQRPPAPALAAPNTANAAGSPETPASGAGPAADGGAHAKIAGTDAVAAVDDTGAQPGVQRPSTTIGDVDARTFAGIFVAEGARFELRADGSYASTVHAASANADLAGRGTWTARDGGRVLLLDPDDGSEPDLRLSVVSHDELRQGGEDGRVLRRQAP